VYTPNSGEIAVRRFIIALRLMGGNLLARCGAKLRRIADAQVLGGGEPPHSKMVSPSKQARAFGVRELADRARLAFAFSLAKLASPGRTPG
jgi:hypothetical protein